MAAIERLRVVARVRPLLSAAVDGDEETKGIQVFEGDVLEVKSGARGQWGTKTFQLNRVLGEKTTQLDVFEEVLPLLQGSLAGFSCSLFAYGQSGSGKTFTMLGQDYWAHDELQSSAPATANEGVIPRSMQWLFRAVNRFKETEGVVAKLSVSYLEIYNERLVDLLSPSTQQQTLEIREYKSSGEMYVPGLTVVEVQSIQEIMEVLFTGAKARSLATTDLNEHSSRAHTIFQCHVELFHPSNKTMTRSKISLVDLAGSEKLKVHQCSNFSQDRVKELKSINKSLSALGACISALLESNRVHVPYRDSKLTRLLQDSLGGNTRTLMIVTLSPALHCYEETVSTLQFADRAMKVQISANPNRVLLTDEGTLGSSEELESCRDEITQLRGVVAYLMKKCDPAALRQLEGDEEVLTGVWAEATGAQNRQPLTKHRTPTANNEDDLFHKLIEDSACIRELEDASSSIGWLRQYHSWLLSDAQEAYEKVRSTCQSSGGTTIPLEEADKLHDRLCMMETSILVQAAELQRTKNLFVQTNSELQAKYNAAKQECRRLRKELAAGLDADGRARNSSSGSNSSSSSSSRGRNVGLRAETSSAADDGDPYLDADTDIDPDVDPEAGSSIFDIQADSALVGSRVSSLSAVYGFLSNRTSSVSSPTTPEAADGLRLLPAVPPAPATKMVTVAGTAPPRDAVGNRENAEGNYSSQGSRGRRIDSTDGAYGAYGPTGSSGSQRGSSTVTITAGEDRDNHTSDAPLLPPTSTSASAATPATAPSTLTSHPPSRKPLWRAISDQATGLTYYHNRRTKETTWEQPSDQEMRLYCE